jgi:hypothetical protein
MKKMTWGEFTAAVEAKGVQPGDLIEIALATGSWLKETVEVERGRDRVGGEVRDVAKITV